MWHWERARLDFYNQMKCFWIVPPKPSTKLVTGLMTSQQVKTNYNTQYCLWLWSANRGCLKDKDLRLLYTQQSHTLIHTATLTEPPNHTILVCKILFLELQLHILSLMQKLWLLKDTLVKKLLQYQNIVNADESNSVHQDTSFVKHINV